MYEEYKDFCVTTLKAFDSALDSAQVFILHHKVLTFFGGKDVTTNRYNDLITVLMRLSLPTIDDELFLWELRSQVTLQRCADYLPAWKDQS